jgi:hypothetical protein
MAAAGEARRAPRRLLPMPLQHARPAWATEIAFRMRRHFLLKLVGTSVITALFFVAYLALLRHPEFPVTTMPTTALDRLIGFQPQALYAYLTLWLYVGAGPGLQRDLRELVVYGLWIVAMCAAGLGIFWAWPTQVPPNPVDVSGFPGFALLQGMDAAGNACPSMHVAAATFTVMRIAQVLRAAAAPAALHLLNAGWFAAIVYSTLAVKQHVALDAAAGMLLGAAFALASLRWRPLGASGAGLGLAGARTGTRVAETAN